MRNQLLATSVVILAVAVESWWSEHDFGRRLVKAEVRTSDDKSVGAKQLFFMPRLKVLISHAHDEKALAEAWKTLIADVLMGAVEAWFSSDAAASGGMELGQEWRDQLYRRLEESDLVIAIQTPTSAGRPWVMWECGVASSIGRERGIIPIVFGMGRGDLANPLTSYQVYSGEDADQVKEVLARIAREAELTPGEHVFELPLKAYMERVTLHRPRKPVTLEQAALWRTRFEELVQSGREAEVPAKREAMYATFGDNFRPVDPALHELLSKILIDQRQFATTVEEVDHALSLVGADVDLLHRKALALTELQNLADAEALIEQVEGLSAELRANPEVASLEGRIHRERWVLTHDPKHLEQAYDAYLRAYTADTTQYYPGINAATLALLRGDGNRADVLFESVLETCRRYQSSEQVSYWVDFTAGEAQLGLGAIDDGAEDYANGMRRSPAPPPRARISALGGARRVIEAKGLPSAALDRVEQILQIQR